MFDWFSIKVPERYATDLLNNEGNGLDLSVNNLTGEIRQTENGYLCHKGEIQGFEITVWTKPNYPSRIEIKGSFHKRFERGSNFADFTFQTFKETVLQFSTALRIPVQEMRIHGMEIGLNIKPPIATNILINGIKTLSRTEYGRKTYKGNGLSKCFTFNQYRVKIYDKAAEYKGLITANTEILRFELKILKMQYLHTKGVNITTMADLITGNYNAELQRLLLNQWEKMIVYPEGYIDIDTIPNPRTRKNLEKGLNPNYWTGLTGKQYGKQLEAFKRNIAQYSEIDLSTAVSDLLKAKWAQLETQPSKYQRGKYYPYIIGNIFPFTDSVVKRYCQSCGKDISHQRQVSKYCSESILGKEGKKCRNRESNKKLEKRRAQQRMQARQKRLYPGLTLFPVMVHFDVLAESRQNVSLTVPIRTLPNYTQTRIYDLRAIYNQYKPTV